MTPTRLSREKEEQLERWTYGFLQKHFNEGYQVQISGHELMILHGMVALAMDHPLMTRMHPGTLAAGRRFRDWVKSVWIAAGLDKTNADLLDRLREYQDGSRDLT